MKLLKEIHVLVGADVSDKFKEAWDYIWKTGEPVTFVMNEVRVVLFKDKP